ncbi:MAG: lipoate--protein ligase family protein [Planctomycetota bacterium]|nr:lipoate--protein ligase family protein [Planctomycetota bacterium]
MRLLELTLPTPAENLALDEALLCEADENSSPTSGPPLETLRIWQSPQAAVVLGRSSKIDEEVHVAECCRRRVPILRRPSGGATVLIGPGCLVYTLLFNLENRPILRAADQTHRFVLDRLGNSLRRAIGDNEISRSASWGIAGRGTSDLAFGRETTKFSGNAIRYGRRHLLYHGTILYDFDIDLVAALLKTPPVAPEYRRDRSHNQFLANLPLGENQIRRAIVDAWRDDERTAMEASSDWPKTRTAALVARRYDRTEWNQRR